MQIMEILFILYQILICKLLGEKKGSFLFTYQWQSSILGILEMVFHFWMVNAVDEILDYIFLLSGTMCCIYLMIHRNVTA